MFDFHIIRICSCTKLTCRSCMKNIKFDTRISNVNNSNGMISNFWLLFCRIDCFLISTWSWRSCLVCLNFKFWRHVYTLLSSSIIIYTWHGQSKWWFVNIWLKIILQFNAYAQCKLFNAAYSLQRQFPLVGAEIICILNILFFLFSTIY